MVTKTLFLKKTVKPLVSMNSSEVCEGQLGYKYINRSRLGSRQTSRHDWRQNPRGRQRVVNIYRA